jgi:hypothetical protein
MKKKDKILLISIAAIIFIGSLILAYFTTAIEIETKKPYPYIQKKDSISGIVTKQIYKNGYIFIVVDNAQKFQTGGADFVNNSYIDSVKKSIDDVLEEDAAISKKPNNDTLKVIYKNRTYIFVLIPENPEGKYR